MSGPQLLGGRYEVGELIGRGGMAEVHLGHDTRLGRPVAIKLLRSDLARDANFLTRFRREAQAAGGLNDPNIVAIYDSGEETTTDAGGAPVPQPYIVMEYVDGETLREKLQRENVIAPSEAAQIVEGVLAALAYSHRMGFVHRDIKPANVMLTRSRDIKVMDFGIARAVADTSATMTQTQAVIGTAQYLSPEQAQGLPVDARSDLYSTGCLLFELLTGRPPFVGDSPVSVAYQHVGERPQPPSSFNHDVPTAYDSITLPALEKERERRYQSATEFRNDLKAARESRPLSAAAAGATVGAAAAVGAMGGDEATQMLGTSRQSDLIPLDDSPEELEGNRDARRRPAWVYALIAAAVVLVLAAATWAGIALFARQSPEQVAVPNLAGLNETAAQAALSRAQLKGQVQNKPSATVAKGQVSGQDPAAGTQVAVQSTVTIDVSTGPDSAAIPNVVGFTQEAATTALQGAGFSVGTIQQVDDNAQAKGNVLGTDPAVGAVTPFSTPITLKVATGKVAVPDVRTTSFGVAQETLQKAGLNSQIQQVDDAKAIEGTVLDQTPSAGTVVDVGSTVTIKVARRPTPTPTTTTVTVTVPPTTPPTSTTTTTTSSTTTTKPP
ncbi:MAG TPA: Stk1 family PASTA domain-containing Ser/Thr kinase [Lapillicoccus sp.]|nr:Stk1 family PASTA domain-containing Ser/Thr kinase [Lapillicoccus sp.]